MLEIEEKETKANINKYAHINSHLHLLVCMRTPNFSPPQSFYLFPFSQIKTEYNTEGGWQTYEFIDSLPLLPVCTWPAALP